MNTFDPIAAYRQASNDLMILVDTFNEKDTALTPQEFLRAITTIGERLRVVSVVMLTGAVATVMEKIPEDVMQRFREQADFDHLMETPEQQREKMMKALKKISEGLNPPQSL